MPFKSRRQWRAAMAGYIPGISKDEAREWAHETRSFKALPDRAPAEKGKATLRSKSASGAFADPAKRALEHAVPKAKGLRARFGEMLWGDRVENLKTHRAQQALRRKNDPPFHPDSEHVKKWHAAEDKALSDELLPERLKMHGARAAVLTPLAVGGVYAKRHREKRAADEDEELTDEGRRRLKDKDRKEAIKQAAGMFGELEGDLARVFKLAALGTAAMRPGNVGKLRGMMTTNAMKAPGFAASTQATNPARNVISAMNLAKPH